MISDIASIMNISPARTIMRGDPIINAAPTVIPPRKREPVSPMNTLAGWKLYTRKPRHPPIAAPEITPSPSLPSLKAQKAKNAIIISETEDTRPSMPSVRFALFTIPTISTMANI